MSILRRRTLIEQGDSRPYWYDIEEDWDYIIDQTGKYNNPIIVNEKNLRGNKLHSISSIRDMSKLVVGYYDETSAKLIWEPLDNSSKTIVKHITSAYPINISIDTYLNDHPTADVFMKLPEFWWRCWNVNDNEDTVAFKFATEEPTDDNNWFHWNGNILIGVYKGHIDEVNNVKLLRSIQNEAISKNLTVLDFKSASRNRGSGYRCVSYEAHQIMAFLFFGFFGSPYNDDITGFGSFPTSTGETSSDGIIEDAYRNFWGLEDWNCYHREYVDNIRSTGNPVTVNNNKTILVIEDINGTSIRSSIIRAFNTESYPAKMILGEYADLVIKENANSYYDFTLFPGTFILKCGYDTYYSVRGDYITGLKVNVLSDTIDSQYTSRLQYEGSNQQNITPSSATSVISSYVLDQTDPNASPDTAIVFDNDNSVILAIKAASDFYALENKAWGSSTPEFIKMSKTNKLKTTRGTTLDANNYDIFMRLPEFWWKCENIDDSNDKVRISFTMTNPNNDTWNHWNGKTFIGVYKASNYSSGNNSWVRSRSGVQPNASHYYEYIEGSQDVGAKNRGDGFSYTTYEIHQVMCLLLWGYLVNINYPETGIQRNINSITGVNDDLGFEDNPNRAINLWGLEDWYGNGVEIIEDLRFDTAREASHTYSNNIILVDNNNVIRTIPQSAGTGNGDFKKVKKFRLGEYGDVIPSDASNESKYSARFGVQYTSKIGERHIYYFVRAAQSYNNSTTFDSLFAGATGLNTPFTSEYYNCRLCYKGNYTIGEEFQV